MTEAEREDLMEFVIDGVKDILNENMGDDVEGKMQAIASISVQILINDMFGRDEAFDLLGKFSTAIIAGLKYADEHGHTTWVSGPGN